MEPSLSRMVDLPTVNARGFGSKIASLACGETDAAAWGPACAAEEFELCASAGFQSGAWMRTNAPTPNAEMSRERTRDRTGEPGAEIKVSLLESLLASASFR